jgi:hypothetical protein
VKRNLAPGVADIFFLVVAPITAVTRTIRLTHSDGDLAAHIRMGDVILSTGSIPANSLSSVTAANDPFIAHGWLSEVVFSLLFSAGGLAAISAVTGIVIAATHSAIALFLRRRGADPRWALAAAFVSLMVASTHWLSRPHMFTIAGVAFTVILLESAPRRRTLIFAAMYALWANLHGGWIFGLMLIALYALGCAIESASSPAASVEWRGRAKSALVALGAAAAATLLNPYALRLHREVISGATSRQLATHMAEFLPPDFQTLAPLPFLFAVLLSFALVALTPRRLSAPTLLIVVATLFLALRSFRNMALFGVSAWPLMALHVAHHWPAHRRRRFKWFGEVARLDPATRTGLYAAPVALLLLAIGFSNGRLAGQQIIRETFSPDRFPVQAVARARAAGLDGTIFDAWEWGGYIMYAWPHAKLVVDPLEFNDTTIQAFSRIDAVRPEWQEELQKWNVKTVLIRPDSRLDSALAANSGWKTWYRDSTAVVFRPATD